MDEDSEANIAAAEPSAPAHAPAMRGIRPDAAGACLNCGTALTGRHCHECGQPARVRRTLSALFHDLLHGVLHLEGKIWRTLPLLAWRPGQLTRRFIEGERVRFVSPVALFLFSVFLMFGTFSLVGGPFEAVDPEDLRTSRIEVARALTLEKEELQRLERGMAEERRVGHSDHAARFARHITETRQAIAALESIPAGSAGTQVRAPVGQQWLGAVVEKIRSDPSLAFYKVQNNAYKLSWLLIPASLPFLWLLFPFSRRFPLYDHAVFVTYSLSFATLLLVTLSLVGAIVGKGDWVEIAIATIMPAHMYRQLRESYGLSWANALLRTLLLVVFAATTLLLFVLLLLALVGG